MTRDVWIAIAAMTVIGFTIKASGPVALGGRELPDWAWRLIALVPSALLPALIVVETFSDGRDLVIDARAAGLAAAMVALMLRGSMLVVVLVAAAVTAAVRALGVG
jgi:branched-subunit amino acid transport protein